MVSDNFGSLVIIDPFLKFEQLKKWKQNKPQQQEKFYENEGPEQNSSCFWL
jgi:hypothetical protein